MPRGSQRSATSEFKREMSLWANFSPRLHLLVARRGHLHLFAFALATGGPPMIWSLVIVGIGQFLVALVFSEVVSQFPVAGGVYPWARRLWGKKWAWMTGWVYIVALLTTIASVTYGSKGPFVALLFNLEPTVNMVIICAARAVAGHGHQLRGTKILSYAAIAGFTAEIAGAIVVGGWLLLFNRENNWRPV